MHMSRPPLALVCGGLKRVSSSSSSSSSSSPCNLLRLLFHVSLFALASRGLSQPLSTPVSSLDALPKSNYTEQPSLVIEDVVFGTEVHSLRSSGRSRSSPQCAAFHRHRFDLSWQHHADSGVYATGLITESLHHDEDALHSSNKLLVLPGFHRYLNLLDHDGHHVPTSPLLLSSSASTAPFHTSPVLFDYNGDGHDDLVWINVDGAVLVINGWPGAQPLLLAPVTRLRKLSVLHQWFAGMDIKQLQRGEAPHSLETEADHPAGSVPSTTPTEPDAAPQSDDAIPQWAGVRSKRRKAAAGGLSSGRRLLQLEDDAVFEHLLDNLPEEARASLLLFSQAPSAALEPFEEDAAEDAQYPAVEGNVWVDAHVLATPTLFDFDHDGSWNELAISVSYFYDQEHYQDNPHLYSRLPSSTDLRSYVAGGLVVLSLTTLKTLWSIQLDLTTDYTDRKAMIYSQPTVVDLDGDGEDEIIVGTSLGLVYVLAPGSSVIRPGFPVVMHEVQGAGGGGGRQRRRSAGAARQRQPRQRRRAQRGRPGGVAHALQRRLLAGRHRRGRQPGRRARRRRRLLLGPRCGRTEATRGSCSTTSPSRRRRRSSLR